MSNDFLKQEFSGGCQCGAVRYHIRKLRANPHFCHCRMCQKAVGNVFASLVGAKTADITWTRGTPSVFRSSEHVERGFCNQCGTPLFYRHDESNGLSVTIGSLDTPQLIPIMFEMGNEGRHPDVPALATAKQMGTTEDADGTEAVAAIAHSNHQHPDHDTAAWPPTE